MSNRPLSSSKRWSIRARLACINAIRRSMSAFQAGSAITSSYLRSQHLPVQTTPVKFRSVTVIARLPSSSMLVATRSIRGTIRGRGRLLRSMAHSRARLQREQLLEIAPFERQFVAPGADTPPPPRVSRIVAKRIVGGKATLPDVRWRFGASSRGRHRHRAICPGASTSGSLAAGTGSCIGSRARGMSPHIAPAAGA